MQPRHSLPHWASNLPMHYFAVDCAPSCTIKRNVPPLTVAPCAAAQARIIALRIVTWAATCTRSNHPMLCVLGSSPHAFCTESHLLRLRHTQTYFASCHGHQASNLPMCYVPWTAVPSRIVEKMLRGPRPRPCIYLINLLFQASSVALRVGTLLVKIFHRDREKQTTPTSLQPSCQFARYITRTD